MPRENKHISFKHVYIAIGNKRSKQSKPENIYVLALQQFKKIEPNVKENAKLN